MPRPLRSARTFFRQLRGDLSEEEISDIAFRPLHDRGGPLSVYSGPSGPIVTVARIMDNHRHGRPLDEGVTHDLSDPKAP